MHDIRFCLHAFWSCIPFCCCSLQLRLLLCKNLEVFIGNPSKSVFLDFTCIALFNMFRNVYMISFKIYMPLWILLFCTYTERYIVYLLTKMIKIIFIRKSVEAGSSFSNSGLKKKLCFLNLNWKTIKISKIIPFLFILSLLYERNETNTYLL